MTTKKPKRKKKAKKTLQKIQPHTAMVKILSKTSDAATLKFLQTRTGWNPNQTDKAGHSMLTLAATQDKGKTLNYLLTQGADLHHTQPNNHNALSGAIFQGHFELAKELIKKGIPIETAKKPLETARLNFFSEVTGIPLESAPKTKSKSKRARSKSKQSPEAPKAKRKAKRKSKSKSKSKQKTPETSPDLAEPPKKRRKKKKT